MLLYENDVRINCTYNNVHKKCSTKRVRIRKQKFKIYVPKYTKRVRI